MLSLHIKLITWNYIYNISYFSKLPLHTKRSWVCFLFDILRNGKWTGYLIQDISNLSSLIYTLSQNDTAVVERFVSPLPFLHLSTVRVSRQVNITVPAGVFVLPYLWQIAIVTNTFQWHRTFDVPIRTHVAHRCVASTGGTHASLPLWHEPRWKTHPRPQRYKQGVPVDPSPAKLRGLKCHYLHLTFDMPTITQNTKWKLFWYRYRVSQDNARWQ